ncbi:MAG: hypothetical protein FWF15_02455 [Oscillospiraceae bacterium]|nr:hypothetical protein [Oscillospiraceae bacterium]
MTKLQLFYNKVPDAPFYQTEFGYYCMEKWIAEGHLTRETNLAELFGFDPNEFHYLGNLGGCEAPFVPPFEVKVLEDRGEHELVQDSAGRSVLYFKNRRSGFMPEYVDHPVKDMATWKEKCAWRLDPKTPERLKNLENHAIAAVNAQAQGKFINTYLVGGYMYLRSLFGPLELLYMFYDDPALIHTCMEAWYEIMNSGLQIYRQYVELDQILFDEDICYKTGSLISDDMICEFLVPYYTKLIDNVKKGQNRKLNLYCATDGYIEAVIPRYMSMGFNYFAPCEVAADCDVVGIGKKYPDILLSGGIDKRVLAQGRDAIDRMCGYIFPAMRKRGGYFPTCDHGVPEEVSFENYVYYRQKCLEYSK